MIKLLSNFDLNELSFKPLRKTATGSVIIDVENEIMYQTCWVKILYDVEYSVVVDAEPLKDLLKEIDNKVVSYSSTVLEFSEEMIINMYKPLLKVSGSLNYFSVSLSTKTILFDRHKNFYTKPEIKDILKKDQHIRFIFKFKKIYFKDHEITFPIETIQIELA